MKRVCNGKFKHHVNDMDFIYLKKKSPKSKLRLKSLEKTDVKELERELSFGYTYSNQDQGAENKKKSPNENSSKDITFALQNRQSLNDTTSTTTNSYYTCDNELPPKIEEIQKIDKVADKKIEMLECNTNAENNQTMKDSIVPDNKDRRNVMNQEVGSCLKNNYKRKLKSRLKKIKRPIEKFSPSVDNIFKLMKKLSNSTVITDRKSIRRVLFSKKYKNSSDFKLSERKKKDKNSSKNNDNLECLKLSRKDTCDFQKNKKNYATSMTMQSHSCPYQLNKQDKKLHLKNIKSLSHLSPASKVYLTPASAMDFSKQLEDLKPFTSFDVESESVQFGFASQNYHYDPINEIFYYVVSTNNSSKVQECSSMKDNHNNNNNNNNKLRQRHSYEESSESLSNTMLEKRGLYHSQMNNCNSIRAAYFFRSPYTRNHKPDVDAYKKEEKVVKRESFSEVVPFQPPSYIPSEHSNNSYNNLLLDSYTGMHPGNLYQPFPPFDKNPQNSYRQLGDFYTHQRSLVSQPKLQQRRHIGNTDRFKMQSINTRRQYKLPYRFYPRRPHWI